LNLGKKTRNIRAPRCVVAGDADAGARIAAAIEGTIK